MASHPSSSGLPKWLTYVLTYGFGFGLAGFVLFWVGAFVMGVFEHSRPKQAEPVLESAAVAESAPVLGADAATATPAPVVPVSNAVAVAPPLYQEGQVIYTTICGVCHQPTGLGLPNMFPPLVGSDWVKAPSPERLIRILLHGFQGPIHINGQPFSTPAAVMPPQGALPDEKIAAVLTYIRHSWGNAASAVTPEQIQAVRQADKDRVGMWTEAELLKVPADARNP